MSNPENITTNLLQATIPEQYMPMVITLGFAFGVYLVSEYFATARVAMENGYDMSFSLGSDGFRVSHTHTTQAV